MRLIDGDRLMMSLSDWWFSSFGEDETEESKAIRTVMHKVEDSLKYFEVTQWIPVTERLPEQGQVVLVWTEWEEYRVFKRDDGDMKDEYKERYFWEEQSSECLPYQRTCVIAWMPLPEPYKETPHD